VHGGEFYNPTLRLNRQPRALNFLIDNWILVLMAVTSGGLLAWPALKGGGAGGGVGTTEAVRLINREKGVLIDVGEPAEFAAGHAAGARNVPLGQIDGEAGKKGLPTNKTLPLVVLCPSGARAGRAAALLRKAGYEKAVALSGGTNAWREASLPVEKST
jgi:rhodanese-related sulfurtransferase